MCVVISEVMCVDLVMRGDVCSKSEVMCVVISEISGGGDPFGLAHYMHSFLLQQHTICVPVNCPSVPTFSTFLLGTATRTGSLHFPR